MSAHNFKILVNTPDKEYTAPKGYRLWHCKRCDSIIKFPARWSETDVNIYVARSMFICIAVGELA